MNNANGRERVELRNKRLDRDFSSRVEGNAYEKGTACLGSRRQRISTITIAMEGLAIKNNVNAESGTKQQGSIYMVEKQTQAMEFSIERFVRKCITRNHVQLMMAKCVKQGGGTSILHEVELGCHLLEPLCRRLGSHKHGFASRTSRRWK